MKNIDVMKRMMSEKAMERTKGNASGFGEALKRQRIKQGWTQEALAHGLCSVSYFSKIENNRLAPSDYFIEGVSRKIGVDLSFYTKTLNGNTHIDAAVQAFFYEEFDKLAALREAVSKAHHQSSNDLFDLFLSVAHKKTQISATHIRALRSHLNTMDPLVAYTFLTLWGLHEVECEKYSLAQMLMEIVEPFNGLNDKLDALSQSVRFLSAQALNKTLLSMEYYALAMQAYQRLHGFQRAIHLELKLLYYMIEECPKTAHKRFMTLKTSIPGTWVSLKQYIDVALKVRLNTVTAKDFDAIDHALKDKYYYETLALFPKSLLSEAQKSVLSDAFENVNPKFKLYKIRHEANMRTDAERHAYMRRVALPTAIEHESVYNIKTYTNELVEEASNNARYKDALALIKKRDKAIEKLQSGKAYQFTTKF